MAEYRCWRPLEVRNITDLQFCLNHWRVEILIFMLSFYLDTCSDLLSLGRHPPYLSSAPGPCQLLWHAQLIPIITGLQDNLAACIHPLLSCCFCQCPKVLCWLPTSYCMAEPASQQHLQLELFGLVANIFCSRDPREFVKYRKVLANWIHNTGGWDFAEIRNWIFKGAWHISIHALRDFPNHLEVTETRHSFYRSLAV